ncbi:hypothetical protein [Streptomyces decoyicus]|uniref:hypothetical protein n=1 Tax=Streptomyces decoyicus TaxID=249567 RepID=UPI0036609984
MPLSYARTFRAFRLTAAAAVAALGAKAIVGPLADPVVPIAGPSASAHRNAVETLIVQLTDASWADRIAAALPQAPSGLSYLLLSLVLVLLERPGGTFRAARKRAALWLACGFLGVVVFSWVAWEYAQRHFTDSLGAPVQPQYTTDSVPLLGLLLVGTVAFLMGRGEQESTRADAAEATLADVV